jgi:ketosteroid isomerase-like protein
MVSLPAPLDAVLRGYEEAWRARDASGLAALFAEDGFILRPGRPPVRGRDALREAYTGSGGPLHLVAYDYAVSDSVGYVIGGFGVARDPGEIVGKFVLALRRTASGTWLIVADMDNGNF